MNKLRTPNTLSKENSMFNSMFAHFIVNVTHEIGAMQRLLGAVRRRGFKVDSMMATQDSGGTGYRVELRLETVEKRNLSFETLARQIARNLDVVSVSMMSPSAALELNSRSNA